MNNDTERAHRQLLIDEAKIDIGLDSMGNQNAIFDLAADHFGSDDDAHYMIHEYAEGKIGGNDIRPRSIAFLELLKHIPAECPYCD